MFDRSVPRKPRLVGGVKGHNMNEISFPGSPALWAGGFTLIFKRINLTLLIVPVMYSVHDDFSGWIRQSSGNKKGPEGAKKLS